MKGVSEFVMVLLILIILVASISTLWLYYYAYFRHITFSEDTSALGEILSSCMEIDSVKNNKTYLKNCGSGLIKNNTLNVFIDEEPFEFIMIPESIGKGEIAEIAIKGLKRGMSIGNHKIKIASPSGKAERYVKVESPSSCVLALDFDEGEGTIAHDSSGNGNDGTLLPVGSEPQWLYGKFGKALNFDGAGEHVIVDDNPSLGDMPQLTVEAWVKLDMLPSEKGAGYTYIINFKSNAWWLNINDDGSVTFMVENETGDSVWPRTSSTLNKNIWYHIVGVYNGSEVKIYLNGVPDGLPYTLTGNVADSANSLYISYSWPFQTMDGIIDSVRIHDKALTPDETIILKLGELT